MNHFFLTLLGFILSVLIDISKRDKESKRTPYEFSLKFFFKDNCVRIGVSFGISIVIVTMYKLADFQLEKAHEDAFAIAVGFCPDLVIGWLKRKFGFLRE